MAANSGTQAPTPIRFPISSFPGASTQESGGRLYNCYAESLDDGTVKSGPSMAVWRRSPGLSQQNNAATGQTGGYRGGLLVGGLSYEVFPNTCITVDQSGNINNTLTGSSSVLGTKKISIARDQAIPPHIVIVDPDNGAFANTGATGALFASYNGGGNLPQPNSVCFQDGYFFYGISDCRVFASPLNSLGTINTQTFITAQARSDVLGQRVVAFSGVIWIFTTGHCEVWTDTAQAAPAFPYSRMVVLPYGLLQPSAIAGFDTGFDSLMWVSQDFGVYLCTYGQFQPLKVSPPDLDRFIETEARAGNTLQAGCYMIQGKRFWTLTSNNASRSWEFNLITAKWNERGSLLASSGTQSRWRGDGGHPAFGKWLMGDIQSGSILYPDDANYTDNGAPQLFRLESGPVDDFPNQVRIARADFDFVFGVGDSVKSLQMTVLGVTAGTVTPSGTHLIRVTVNNTAQMIQGDQVNITGTVMAGVTNPSPPPPSLQTTIDGTYMINLIDGYNFELQNTSFLAGNTYTSGGTAMALFNPPNVTSPQVAISCSKDGGFNWGNPLLRSLGQQQKAKRVRASVKSMGLSGPMGNRWRLDVTDAVYTAFLKGTQASDPRYVGD